MHRCVQSRNRVNEEANVGPKTNKQGMLNVIRIYTLYSILHVETEQFWLKRLGPFIDA